MEPTIKVVFERCQPSVKDTLLTIRQWVFDIANTSENIGEINECLKWGEPSYLTHTPKSGTTVRLAPLKANPQRYGLFVHCQTRLIEEFRLVYPDLDYDKNRGILFDSRDSIQEEPIKQFIFAALTYQLRKSINN
ncbi:DUF1801 domain-containing protein [uncultured Paraglaciecola sp.]|uniref:DUF1801 domain-containing protein n=1 Tax=uncultured Paraglaciecola sp. TaxID=1765024 RepID=UPI002598FFB5|nr:DUF1801 domain-containing protein [uncultured Paraglaciecola sp.]